VPARARILLVEDALDHAVIAREALEQHGFDIDWVQTVPEGTRRLATHDYSVVLCDYITGRVPDAAQQARELLDVAGAVPVVCITAWRFSTSELSDRFAFVLNKPFVPDELLAVVATLVSLENRPYESEQVHRYFDCLSRRNWEGLGALCTENVEYRVPQAGTQEFKVVVGRANFVSMARETFAAFPDARFEVKQVAALPRGAVARYRGRWTLRSHEVASLDAAVTFSFAAGCIAGIGVRLDVEKLRTMSEVRVEPAT
jgi:DNA-binding response OmpR family regulator